MKEDPLFKISIILLLGWIGTFYLNELRNSSPDPSFISKQLCYY